MPKEKEMYRENLRILTELFPGRVMISQIEAAKVLGVDVEALARSKTFPRIKLGGRYHVSLVNLANLLS